MIWLLLEQMGNDEARFMRYVLVRLYSCPIRCIVLEYAPKRRPLCTDQLLRTTFTEGYIFEDSSFTKSWKDCLNIELINYLN